jgi:asparagine synthase (glutamine-hydrolysing)
MASCGDDFAQAARAELPAEREQVVFEDVRVRVVFELERLQDLRERASLGHELPHPRADRVQSEVRAALQIQQHGLSIELPKEDVFGNRNRVVQRQRHDGVDYKRCAASGIERMSGILGIWHLDGRPVEPSEVARLSATERHCGRDLEAMRIDGAVGLACCLNRILPESANETQPLVDVAGAAIVFDGRLDNREELLAALERTAAVSNQSPDSALALAAYRTFGDDFPARLNGDFALAFFDPVRRQLLLARDAVGVRPLYYYTAPDIFLFASEIKTLLSHPRVERRPDDGVLAAFLLARFNSHAPQERTFFQNVLSVLPGHSVLVDTRGLQTRQYWDFDPEREIRFARFEDYAGAFKEHFERAVQRRLRGTAPVAVSVSGGLDSSAIFCAGETLRRVAPDRHAELLGVSYTSPRGSPADESAFLTEIELAYGVSITRFDNLPIGIMDNCRRGIWHAEAPFLDPQWNGTHAYLGAIRQLGARVVLTGHWGDQFLFDDAYLLDLCRRGAWRDAWRHVNEYSRWVDVPARRFKRRLLAALLKEYAPQAIVAAYRRARDIRRPVQARSAYTKTFVGRAGEPPRPFGVGRRHGSAHAQSLYREVRSRYHVFCMEWNHKVAAMHGLEMAFPFLDRDLIGFLMAIPGEVQSRDGVQKGILRAALQGILPPAIAARVSKADFASAVNEGMKRDYNQLVDCLRTGGLATRLGYLRLDGLNGIGKPDVNASTCTTSWALGDVLSLELWLQVFFGSNDLRFNVETDQTCATNPIRTVTKYAMP